MTELPKPRPQKNFDQNTKPQVNGMVAGKRGEAVASSMLDSLGKSNIKRTEHSTRAESDRAAIRRPLCAKSVTRDSQSLGQGSMAHGGSSYVLRWPRSYLQHF